MSRGAGRVPGVLNLFIDFALNPVCESSIGNSLERHSAGETMYSNVYSAGENLYSNVYSAGETLYSNVAGA